jgi:serine/threonine-protein kinase
MGTVYVAVQQDLGRCVALKVLDPLLSADPAQVERFRRESQAAALAHHPNVVQITDFQWLPGEPPILVMELLSGESLARRIERVGPLSAGEVARVASQVLSALETAHAAGIVHRDLKPDNVHLVTIPSVGEIAKVLDFGIAKLGGQERVTATGALLGTPAYMAPEQVRGEPVDPRTDLYGVGAFMYHALTGALPHTADSASAMLYAILQKEPVSLATLRPDLPSSLVGIVARALAKDPAQRFQSAAEMRAALAPIAASTTGAPLPSSGPAYSAPPITAQEMHAPTMSVTPSGPASPLALSSGGAPTPPYVPAPTAAQGGWGPPVASSISGPPGPGPILGSAPGTAATSAPRRAGGAGCAVAAVLVALIGAVTAVVLGFMFLVRRDADTSVTVTAGSSTVSLSTNKRGPGPVATAADPVETAQPPVPATTAGTLAPPPPTTPTTAKTPAPPASAPGASVASAPATTAAAPSAAPSTPPLAPVAKGAHPFSGKRRNGGGADFSECKGCDSATLLGALGSSHHAAVDACLAASQYEGPEHEHNSYVVTVDNGKVVRVDRIASETPVRNLDACITGVLKSIPMKPVGSGTGRLYITSECVIGWPGQCRTLTAGGDAAAR